MTMPVLMPITHVETNLRKFGESDAHQSFLNGERTANRVQGIIFASDGRPKERHESIAAKFVERPPEFKDGVDDERQIAIEDVDDVLRIELLGEGREAAKIAEQNRDFALVAAQLQVTPGIGDDLGGHLRRNVPAKKITEQVVLRLDVIVERLDPEERLDSRQQLFAVNGFAQKIVGPCFDAANSISHVGERGRASRRAGDRWLHLRGYADKLRTRTYPAS